MIRKSSQFAQAQELRRRGFTYEEIARIVDVSKSTVSNWFSRETWSENIKANNQKRAARENSKRISLLNKARENQHKKLYAEAERSAATEYKHYKKNPLFIAGLMLYMSAGDGNSSHLLRLTSSKPDSHRIFIAFAKEYLGVPREKVRFWLLLHPSHSPATCIKYWSKEIRISSSQFHRYQVVDGKPKKTLHFGIGNTIIGSTVLKRKLFKWTELALKDL